MEDDDKKVEGTEEKSKSLIDRFWWIIPPVFITFVYWPFVTGGYLSFERYVESIKRLFSSDVDIPMFFWSYFFFGFMALGMLLTRRWSFISLRIIVPIIFAILGSFIGVFIAVSMSPLG